MATVNAAEVMIDLERGWVGPATKDLIVNNLYRCIELPFAQKFTIPSTTNDGTNAILRLLKFPTGCYLWGLRATPSDMDTGVAALVYSILAIDDADATKLTIVSGSTNGQAAAGSDSSLAAAYGRYVGNQWLAYKVTTPSGTAAAGTLKLAMKFSIGVINRGKRGTYLQDAEA